MRHSNPSPAIRHWLCAAIGALTVFASGCAGTGTGNGSGITGRTGGGLPADCIINRGVRDFERLDNRNLILYGPGSRAYHVVLTTPAIDLAREITIGVLDDDGRICPYGGDAIIIDGVIRERIPIRSIEALDPADLEALKVEFGLIEAADDAVSVTEIE